MLLTVDSNESERLNIIVVGDRQVGKSRLLDTYCLDGLRFRRIPKTEGVDIHVKELLFDKGLLMCQFYDFSGEFERKDHLSVFFDLLFRNEIHHIGEFPIHAIFVCFDVTNLNSLYNVGKWISWVRQCIKNQQVSYKKNNYSRLLVRKDTRTFDKELDEYLDTIPLYFVGNKIDLLYNNLETKMRDIAVGLKNKARYDNEIQTIKKYIQLTFGVNVYQNNNLLLTSYCDNHIHIDNTIINIYKHQHIHTYLSPIDKYRHCHMQPS